MDNSFYLGVMSGTSLDGVDLALMQFEPQLKLIAADCTPMPSELRAELTQLLQQGHSSLQRLGELDHRLGLLYADCINTFLAKHQLKPEHIRAIGCHGQTIWHSPNGAYSFTMQIGDANIIAVKTGIDTVADFRRKDMAYGGQGAPLVPAFHRACFFDSNRITAVLNIGGISNVSWLIPNQTVSGYDIGPGNALMDSWIEQHFGKNYDENGEWASSGKVNNQLLTTLLAEPYFQQPAPKSTGRELFNLSWFEKITQNLTVVLPENRLSPADIQRTLLELTAQSIANDLNAQAKPVKLSKLLLVCGGGARNGLLMQRLSDLLPEWSVTTTDRYGLPIDYVEAAAFAWLAQRRIHQLPSNLPSVTGASQAVSLGAIYPKL